MACCRPSRAAMSSELTSGMPPESSVASVREICAVASLRASGPKYGIAAWPREAACVGRAAGTTDANADHAAAITSDDRGRRCRRDSSRSPRPSASTAAACGRRRTAHRTPANSGTTWKTISPTTDHRQHDEHGRIDQRRDHMRSHGGQHLDVLDVAADAPSRGCRSSRRPSATRCRRRRTCFCASNASDSAVPDALARGCRRASPEHRDSARACAGCRATGRAAARP